MPARPLAADDLLRFAIIDDFRCAPAGDTVVYALRSAVAGKATYRSNLWRVRPGAEPRQLTGGDHSDRAPRFSPDGLTLAFLSDRPASSRACRVPAADGASRTDAKLDDAAEARTQLHLLPLDGGEAVALTDLDGTFGAPVWLPDGQSLLVPFQPRDPVPAGRKTPLMHRIRRLPWRQDGRGILPSTPFHVFRVWLDGRPPQQLTHGDADCLHPAVAPDGHSFAFISNRRGHLEFEEFDLYLAPIDGSDERLLTDGRQGSAGPAAFTPDGRKLLFCGHDGQAGDWLKRNMHVFALDLTAELATGARTDLTPDLDRCTGPLVLSDLQGIDWTFPPPVQEPDGALVFPVSQPGRVELVRRQPDGRLDAIPLEDSVCGVRPLGDGSLVVLSSHHLRPAELHHLPKSGPVARLTRHQAWLEADVALRPPEELWYQAPDGTRVQGWVITPEGAGPHPTIVQIHGGPMIEYGASFVHELHWLAAQGYAVFYCNPRGSQGYGEAFARAIKLDWGTGPMADVMAGVDLLLQRGVADPARLGVTGGSYGGYLTNWIIAHTQRFGAAVTQRTVSDMASLFWDSDFGPSFCHEMGGWPDETPQVYARNSPMTHVRRVRTPTLVLHSLADERTTPAQGYQLFQALQLLGVPSEMVLFPESCHDLSRTGPTDQRLARLRVIREWFDRYLLPGVVRADS